MLRSCRSASGYEKLGFPLPKRCELQFLIMHATQHSAYSSNSPNIRDYSHNLPSIRDYSRNSPGIRDHSHNSPSIRNYSLNSPSIRNYSRNSPGIRLLRVGDH